MIERASKAPAELHYAVRAAFASGFPSACVGVLPNDEDAGNASCKCQNWRECARLKVEAVPVNVDVEQG